MSSGSEALPAELRRKFAEIRKWQGVSKVVTVLVVIVVSIMFGVFTVSTKSGVSQNFTDSARNQRAAEEAIPKVTPLVTDSIRKVYEEAAPVYQKLASERYERVRRNLGAQVAIRFEKLPEQGGRVMAEKITNAFDNAIKKIEPELSAAFPSLTDAQRRDLLINHFNEVIEEKNKTLATQVGAIETNEKIRIHAILDKFALPPDEAAAGSEELGKELVQTLLLLAQQELESLGKPKTVPAVPAK